MGLLSSIAKLAREVAARVITDGTNVLGTNANPFYVSGATATIGDGTVTTAKLAAAAVTVDKLDPMIAGAAEQVAASGALSVVKRTTILNISGTKAYTLADGTVAGQRKTVYCRGAASTPVGVLTPANPHNFATITWNATGMANSFVELEWNGTAWDLCGIGGATPPAIA